MEDFVGIDLGATNITVVVGSVDDLSGKVTRPTPRGPSGIDVTEAVLETVRDACDRAGMEPTSIAAGAIGSFGPLDLAEGMVVEPANLPADVHQIPLTGPCAELLDAPVYLHNDTTAGVIGERFVATESPGDMVYLTISTGIGAGVAVDGHVLAGWDGNAGEVGHIPIDPCGRMRCGCGATGHWEAYCSGSGIPRYATSLFESERIGETTLPIGDANFSAADVFANPEDPLADMVIERVGRWNAIGLASVVHAYAPMVVAVGGAVALENEEAILQPMRERLDEHVMTNVPEVRLTSLGTDMVALGALASAMTAGTGDSVRVPS